MEKIRTGKNPEPILRKPKTLEGTLARTSFTIKVLTVILLAVSAKTKAEEVKEENELTGLVPFALSEHPSNRKNPTYEAMRTAREAELEKSQLHEVFPNSEEEIKDLFSIAQALRITSLSDPNILRKTSYAGFIGESRRALGDIHFEVSAPKTERIVDFEHETKITTHEIPSGRDHPILYLSFDDFYGKNLIPDLEKILNGKTYDHIMVDMRDNVGGRLSSASEFLDLFFKSGTTAPQFFNGEAATNEMQDDGNEVIVENGFLILTNRITASAAELCVLGFDTLGPKRTVIIGDQTRGKWCIQRIHQFDSGIQVKVTCGIWNQDMPGSGIGIQPDIRRIDLLKAIIGEDREPTEEEILEFRKYLPLTMVNSAKAGAFFKKD